MFALHILTELIIVCYLAYTEILEVSSVIWKCFRVYLKLPSALLYGVVCSSLHRLLL